MVTIENLATLIKGLSELSEEVTLVSHDKASNSLSFIQVGNVVTTSSITDYYFPPTWRYSVMFPSDLHQIKSVITDVITYSTTNNLTEIFVVPKIAAFDIWAPSRKTLNFSTGPKLIGKIKLYSIKYEWLSKLVLVNYSSETKMLLKLIKNNGSKNTKAE